MNKNKKIGFIGCGHMATAIIQGIINTGFLPKDEIIASEVSEEFAKAKNVELGIEVITDNVELAKNSEIIFVATKPNAVENVLTGIKSVVKPETLIVSIAAGVRISKIQNILPISPTIRVMPNAGALVNEGMFALAKGKYASTVHLDLIIKLLENIGKCLVIKEEEMDVVTAISGSGPAFFYKTIHEMAKAGEKLGLDYEKSLQIAAQTAIGSAKIMLESADSPQTLIDKICTKGGCTEVGVEVMYKFDTEKLFFDVIEKTTQKAKSLG